MPELTGQIVWYLISAIFGAGVAYGSFRGSMRSSRRDVNALGQKANRISDDAARRSRNIELALMTVCRPEDRARLVGILKGE